jgi:MFS family permease
VATDHGRGGRNPVVALVATLAIQIFTSLAATATPVLAPLLAADLAVPERWVGLFVGIVYVGAIAASLLSGLAIARAGPIRVSQACVLLCAAGVAAIALIPAGAVLLLVVPALVVGIGYGPITPASSHVLVRTAPPSRMALTFSIKQTGVPAGAALAGAALPGAALALGWRAAFVLVALIGVAVAVAAQPIRAALDADRGPARGFSLADVRAPLVKVWRSPGLRGLSLVGFAYAATQACVLAFLVVHLTATLGWPIVAAGLGLTAATVGGVAGRIGWGVVADRTGQPRRVLALIGFVAGACAIAVALAQPHWPAALVAGLCALLGGTALGWNGVQLAEVARESPPGEAGAITGGSGVITFLGVVAAPPLFAAASAASGTYRVGFALAGAGSLACAALLLAKSRRRVADQRLEERQ